MIGIVACLVRFKILDYDTNAIVGIIMFAFVWSFCASVYINCYMDYHQPSIYKRSVERLYTSRQRTTQYYVLVEGWKYVGTQKNLCIDETLYNSINIGDSVTITVRQGCLGGSWYEVSK